MQRYKPGIKVGYLGGGQLARMLADSASNMGLFPHVLSSNATDPAAQVTSAWKKGDLNNSKILVQFLKSVDVATFESEFLDSKKLEKAQKIAGTTILPSPQVMAILQDRKTQKALFDQHNLPTAEWADVSNQQELNRFVSTQSLPMVLKKRFFGYDGYGTFVIKTHEQLKRFLKKDWQDDLFIIEKFIPFKREIAVMVARSVDGSTTHFPFVESRQVDARCDWVCGPLDHRPYSSMLRNIKRFLNKINYVGVMGVEFFETKNGLIINEIAPRVHNSGHYSQNTNSLSQFDVHNMCLLGLPLPKEIKISGGFAMANLIGSGKSPSFNGGSHLHWYGKSENRKGRKMGHINCVAATPKKALNQVLKQRKGFTL